MGQGMLHGGRGVPHEMGNEPHGAGVCSEWWE